MRILLVGETLRFRSFNGANKALPVLASSLHQGGFSDVVQMDLERSDITSEKLCRQAAVSDLIAFAGCMTPQWPELDANLIRVRDTLAAVGRSHVPIVIGGYATKNVEDVARCSPWITAFFDGEGEEGIRHVAAAIAAGRSLRECTDIAGLCFVRADGKFQRSTAPRVTSLDLIDQGHGFVHLPHVHDMDIFTSPSGRQLKTAQLFTQRGCPWRCSFCNKSMESNEVRRLSEEALRSQLALLRQQGFDALYIDVDTFTVSRQAAEREAVLFGEYGFVWGSNTRIDQIDIELMQFSVKNGCRYMFFGVEHIDPGVCVAIEKFNGTIPQQIRRALAYPAQVRRVFHDMRSAGLPSSYFIILGLPKAILSRDGTRVDSYRATTFEEDVEAIRFGLEQCGPDYLNLNVLRFMPGSAAADVRDHPAYTPVRPSGGAPVTAGHFLPRVAAERGYRVTANHPIYRLCESVGLNQPTTTALCPDRVYATVHAAIQMINARINAGKGVTRLFVERDLLAQGLVRRDHDGCYALAPMGEWEQLGAVGSSPAIEPA